MSRLSKITPQSHTTALPPVPSGLGTSTVWFGGGRMGVSVADHGGIEEVRYFGAQPLHRSEFFRSSARSAYARVFRPYLLVENRAYALELNRTEIFPGGYRSRLDIPGEGVSIEHWLIVVNDAFLQSIRVLANRRGQKLRMRTALHNYNRKEADKRTWSDWKADRTGTWTAKIVDPDEDKSHTTWCDVVADRPLSMRAFHSGKLFFETNATTRGAITTAVLFGSEKAAFQKRANSLRRGASDEAQAALRAWQARSQTTPVANGLTPAVESFVRQQPMILDSLSLTDVVGAMRASVGHYWVWGWDTIVYGDSYLFAGSNDFVKGALDLYERTADPQKGIAHAFRPDFTIGGYQALAAQGLYGVWLYHYAAHTGDIAKVKRHYPFARKLFNRTLTQDRKNGLCVGTSLFPDFPSLAGHNGHDISVFNNAIFYQAARCMEYLAGMVGDTKTAASARAAWTTLEKTFRERFWDAKKGFWVDSLDSRDLTARRSYPSYAILWVTPFARELVAGREAQCAQFMAQQHASPGGIRMYPLWDSAFNGDGNQMGQHYPVGSDVAFLNLMATDHRQSMLRRWLGWVDEFWQQYTVPEGVTVEAENDGPRRPDCPGGKQPFAAKAWQVGMLNGIIGVHFDAGGITTGPGLDRPLTLAGLPFQGKRWTVSTKGRGAYIRQLRVNGKTVTGSWKVPADLCGGKDEHGRAYGLSASGPQGLPARGTKGKTIRLEIERSTKPAAGPQLIAADGAQVTNVRQDAKMLRLHLSAPGTVRVWFEARGRVTFTWNGATVAEGRRTNERRCVTLLPSKNGKLAGELTLQTN